MQPSALPVGAVSRHTRRAHRAINDGLGPVIGRRDRRDDATASSMICSGRCDDRRCRILRSSGTRPGPDRRSRRRDLPRGGRDGVACRGRPGRRCRGAGDGRCAASRCGRAPGRSRRCFAARASPMSRQRPRRGVSSMTVMDCRLSPIRFTDDAAVRRLAQRLAASAGRRLDDSSPSSMSGFATGPASTRCCRRWRVPERVCRFGCRPVGR